MPAYGRKVDTKEEIVQHWQEGQDMKQFRGNYFSIRDTKLLKELGYETVIAFYGQDFSQYESFQL